MRRFLASALAAGLVLSLAACGQQATAPAPSTGSGAKTAPATGQLAKLKIATVSPLSSGAVALGEAIKLGAQVALNEKKDALAKVGYDVELLPKDDQGKPDVGAQVAAQLLSDNQVLGIVGTLNSGVALAIMPKIKDAQLVMVSPANTNPELTKKGYESFNRVIFTDDFQGPAGARFAASKLNAKSAYVIHDKTPYGQGLAEFFAAEAKRLNIEVKGMDGSDDKQTDFSAIVTKIVAANPDVIYYGGLAQAGSNLIKQARDKGVKSAFLGGDGWDDPDLVKLAGAAAEGVYFTSIDADLTAGDAQRFIAEYKKLSAGKEPPSYGAYAYDATNVMLNALLELGEENGGKAPTRADLSKAVRATKGLRGLGGDISFDGKGDNPSSKIFVFQVKGGKNASLGAAPAN